MGKIKFYKTRDHTKMKLFAALAAAASAQVGAPVNMAPMAPIGGGMMGGMMSNPLMLSLLLKDDSSSSNNDLLTLMMLSGGMGGQMGGQMNPLMLSLLWEMMFQRARPHTTKSVLLTQPALPKLPRSTTPTDPKSEPAMLMSRPLMMPS